MKAIINWIVLIPVLILSVGVELFAALNPVGAQSFFGMDVNGISEIILIVLVALFAVFFGLSLLDRKTSPVHILKHNYAAGICAVIAAFSLAGDTAATVAEGVRGSGFAAMDVILLAVSALAAIALLLVGINHCTASNTKSSVALLYLSVPLWCAVHLLSRFMTHTATPVAMSETMDLVMYVCLAIFFMYAMMVVSLINGKNPVKATIYWGAPAAVASLVYAVSVIGTVMNTQNASMFDYLEAVTCAFLGLYVLSFMAELSFMSKTKTEQFVLETENDEQAAEEASEDNAEEETAKAVAPVKAVQEEVVSPDYDVTEDEINQSMKKYFNDISSVESEIETDESNAEPEVKAAVKDKKPSDYGSYFDAEENDEMYIESENIAVDTTKKRTVDKTKYPVTSEKTEHQHAGREEYVVGIDEVEAKGSYKNVNEDFTGYVLDKTDSLIDDKRAEENYEARLDEIDRLIISIQGGDTDK